MPRIFGKRINFDLGSTPFWALTAFLLLAFLTGGGARADVQSLVILRPAAVIFCGVALWSLTLGQVREHRFLFGITAAIFALAIGHVIPLPPSVWSALPGRGIIAEIDRAAGLGAVWRPISMVPSASWNAIYSLFVPLAVLLFGVQLSREQRFRLLSVLLMLGLISGFWGILQVIGDPKGPLYLYRLTNNGSSVGLFSNRNHEAILLAMLFPMLAILASAGIRTNDQANKRGWIAIAAGVILVPLILVTGSRAGLTIGVLALAFAAALYRKPEIDQPKKRKVKEFDWRYPIGAFVVLCLGALTVIMSRAEALQRLTATNQAEDQRLQVWGPISKMAWEYFPAGSGIGSFVEVYQIDEPRWVLNSNYLNHAHNDWLELYMTAGLPGIVILCAALLGFFRATLAAFRRSVSEGRDVAFARLGAAIGSIFALGSLVDYPLRTPALACVFIISMLWLHGASERTKTTGG